MRRLLHVYLVVVLILSVGCGARTTQNIPETEEKLESKMSTETSQDHSDFESLEPFYSVIWHGDRPYVEGFFDVDSKGTAHFAWMDSRLGNDCHGELHFTKIPKKPPETNTDTASTEEAEPRYYQFYDGCDSSIWAGEPKIKVDSAGRTHLLWPFSFDTSSEVYGFIYLIIHNNRWYSVIGNQIDDNNLNDAFLEVGDIGYDDFSFALDGNNNPHIFYSTPSENKRYNLNYIKWDGWKWVNQDGNEFSLSGENFTIMQTDFNPENLKIELDVNIPHFLWVDTNNHGDDLLYLGKLENQKIELLLDGVKESIGIEDIDLKVDINDVTHIYCTNGRFYRKYVSGECLTYKGTPYEDGDDFNKLPLWSIFVDDYGVIHTLTHNLSYLKWNDYQWNDWDDDVIKDIFGYEKKLYDLPSGEKTNFKLKVDTQGIPHIIWTKWSFGPDIHYLTWK